MLTFQFEPEWIIVFSQPKESLQLTFFPSLIYAICNVKPVYIHTVYTYSIYIQYIHTVTVKHVLLIIYKFSEYRYRASGFGV